MKNDNQIDRLLNAFIDGDLSLREQNEVKRLVAHDAEAAKRLNQLQKCRQLLQSLPVSKAPETVLPAVLEKLKEREVEQKLEPVRRFLGSMQLVVRKSLAVAALLMLVSGLAVMIYYIVSPLPQKTNIDIGSGLIKPPVLTARLELKAKTPEATYAFAKFFEDKFAAAFTTQAAADGKSVYTLTANPEKIAGLSGGLQKVWQDFSFAALSVDTNEPAKAIVVSEIKPNQFVEILSQKNLNRQLKAADYYSILNNSKRPGTTSYPNDIPVPVLAKDESREAALPPPIIHLTIEISPE